MDFEQKLKSLTDIIDMGIAEDYIVDSSVVGTALFT